MTVILVLYLVQVHFLSRYSWW